MSIYDNTNIILIKINNQRDCLESLTQLKAENITLNFSDFSNIKKVRDDFIN